MLRCKRPRGELCRFVGGSSPGIAQITRQGGSFLWSSPIEVDALTPGVYNRNYTVGDKVIYVTFKIVEAPDNDGTTTVVF